jgi:uncharacterized protein (TIGR03067 family)
MSPHAVMLLAALHLGSAPAPLPRPDRAKAAIKQEWKRLDGTWTLTSAVAFGKELSLGTTALTLKQGKYASTRGEDVIEEGTATVDPTTTPKSLDLRASTGPYKGKLCRAIYEVRGGAFRVCLRLPGQPRPKRFESKEGSDDILATFKRSSPEPAPRSHRPAPPRPTPAARAIPGCPHFDAAAGRFSFDTGRSLGYKPITPATTTEGA